MSGAAAILAFAFSVSYAEAGPSGVFFPSIAYSPVANEFVLINHDETVTPIAIKARQVDSTGATLSTHTVAASDNLGSSVVPAIAADLSRGTYLVVWEEAADTSKIFGQLLNRDGTTSAGKITVASSSNTLTAPRVAYDSLSDSYLVVWEIDPTEGDSDVGGQRVSGKGEKTGDFIAVADSAVDEVLPAIAADTRNGGWVVVWEDHTLGVGIVGRAVDTNGEPADDLIQVSTTEDLNEFAPSVAYDAVDDWFMSAFTASGSIYYRRFQSDGTLLGDVLPAYLTDAAREADIAFAAVGDQFLITYTFNPSGDNVYAQYVSSDGEDLFGDQIPISVAASTEDRTHVAANEFCGNFGVTYDDYNTEFVTTPAAIVGDCSPNDPSLLWGGGEPGPSSGNSGDKFTFKVTYYSSDGKAPDEANLLIDLDGDGSFAAAVHKPARGGGGGGIGSRNAAGLMFALLAALSLFLAGRRHLPAPAFGALAVGLVMIGMLALVACSSGGGGGGGGGGDDGGGDTAAPETVTMTEDDPSDTNYADGKDYSVELTIDGDARDIPYQFAFSNSHGDALGLPALPQTLTLK